MKKIGTGLGLLLVAGVSIWFWQSHRGSTLKFTAHPVTRGSIEVNILTTGAVQPENRLEIKSPIAGRVEKVLVKEGQKVRKGQILAWMSSTERAALLDAARSQGEEEVKRWEGLYRPTPVVAPLAGTIISRAIEPGQSFISTDSILVMSDRLTVKAQVDETDIAKVALRQEAEIVLDAYSDSKISAKVDQIAFEAKSVNNVTTYLVDILPNKTPDFMRAGMTANVSIFVESKEGVLWVPTESVRVQDGVSRVWMQSSDRTPVEREIKTGLTNGKKTEITSGLTEGEVILIAQTNPSTRSKPGINPFAPGRIGTAGRRGGH